MTSTIVRAQFPQNNTQYVYEYSYTNNNGEEIKNSKACWFIVFKDNYLGYAYDSSPEKARSNVMADKDYYYNKASKEIKAYNDPDVDGATYPADICVYTSNLSTSARTTYRRHKKDRWNAQVFTYTYPAIWKFKTAEWGDECFSFSKDGSTLIIWNLNKSEIQHYYKRISVDDLRPNASFLYE